MHRYACCSSSVARSMMNLLRGELCWQRLEADLFTFNSATQPHPIESALLRAHRSGSQVLHGLFTWPLSIQLLAGMLGRSSIGDLYLIRC